jgi:hypothetical protein
LEMVRSVVWPLGERWILPHAVLLLPGKTRLTRRTVFILADFGFKPPRVNSMGLSKKEILGQIDYIGGFLSISGMILFM